MHSVNKRVKKNILDTLHGKLEDLESLWENHGLPEGIRQIYRNSMNKLSISQLKSFLKQEIFELENGSSLILICLQNILAREESIDSLNTLHSNLLKTKNWTYIDEIKAECAEMLSAYRMLTINLVEKLLEWKDFMSSELQTSDVDIEYSGEIYLHRIYHDMSFLKTSELGKIFDFIENDPFLMAPSKIARGKIYASCMLKDDKLSLILPIEIYNKAKSLYKLIQDECRKKDKNNIIIEHPDKSELSDVSLAEFQHKDSEKNIRKKKSYCKEYDVRLTNFERDQLDSSEHSVSFTKKSLLKQKNFEAKENPINNYRRKLLQQSIKHYENTAQLSEKKQKPIYQRKMNSSAPKSSKKLDPIIPRIKLKAKSSKRLLDPAIEYKKTYPKYFDESMIKPPSSLRKQYEIKRFLETEMQVYSDELFRNILDDLINEHINENFCKILIDECLQNLFEDQARVSSIDHKIMMIKQLKDLENGYVMIDVFEDILNTVLKDGVHNICEQSHNEIVTATNLSNVSKVQRENTKASTQILANYNFNYESSNENYHLQQINEKEKNIGIVIERYFSFLPEIYQSYLPTMSSLLLSANSHINPSWYWFAANNISGLLVFSISMENQKRIIIVHHISCIQIEIFEKFLILFENILQNQGFKSIEFPLMPINFQNIVKGRQFTGNSSVNNNTFQIRASCRMTINKEQILKEKYSDHMIEIGIWHSIISELILLKHNPSSKYTYSRLQKEIRDMNQIILSVPNFSYPFTGSQINLDIRPAHSCISLAGRPFLRFKNVKTKLSEDFTIYFIPSNIQSTNFFFVSHNNIYEELLSEFKTCKTDLFYKVEAMLQDTQKETITDELWVPCFSKNNQQECEWMSGYQISEQSYIHICEENLDIKVNCICQTSGMLKLKKKKNFISKDFIFGNINIGIEQEDITEILCCPLLVCLIHE